MIYSGFRVVLLSVVRIFLLNVTYVYFCVACIQYMYYNVCIALYVYIRYRRIYETRFNKKAFTLAEVLITLGIIGVVAAMTLPALIQKQHRKETSVKLKKVLQPDVSGNTSCPESIR